MRLRPSIYISEAQVGGQVDEGFKIGEDGVPVIEDQGRANEGGWY